MVRDGTSGTLVNGVELKCMQGVFYFKKKSWCVRWCQQNLQSSNQWHLRGNRRRLECNRRRLEGNRWRLEGNRRQLECNRRRLKGN